VSTVYPKIFDKMKTAVMAGLTPNSPYSMKQSASLLMGDPLDSSLTPSRILSLQSSFAPQAPTAPAGKPKKPSKGLEKIDLADRYSLQPKDE
jgi:hypothetical protein